MSFALEKTLSLLLMILLGIFLRGKLGKDEHKKGLKVIILDLALPAMIFVALLGIDMKGSLILLPALVLVWNLFMLIISYFILPLFGMSANGTEHRTWMMLFPSLAPGLSCFPFITEYLGEEALAWAALGDVGNKLFVLVITYLLAMSWYYRLHQINSGTNSQKIKSLLITMVKEPINLVLLSAMILLSIGWNLESLPGPLQSLTTMLKDLMTPLILLFIGISVILKWNPLRKIISMLLVRAGISLLISGLIIGMVQFSDPVLALFVVVFPLSSASFWPFAHMAAVTQLESNGAGLSSRKTFDMDLAINILAVSLPLSTLLILGVFSAGTYFVNPLAVLALGGVLIAFPVVPRILSWARNLEFNLEPKRPSLKRE
jgi:malate permease and related proteins